MRRWDIGTAECGELFSNVFLAALVVSVVGANISSAAGSVSLGIETPRRAFYRGEEIRLTVSCSNKTDKTIAGTLAADLGGCITASDRTANLAPGGEATLSFRFPTRALKADPYVLNLVLTSQSTVLAEMHEPFVVAKKPNPHRLLIWLWGGGGGQWYLDHGFTTWAGPSWQNPAGAAKALDDGLAAGAACGLCPNGGVRDIAVGDLHEPDAVNRGVYSWQKDPLANPLHPEVIRKQDEANGALMIFVKDWPQVQTAFFNTELVDELAPNRNEAGIRMMRESLGFTDADIELVKGITEYIGTPLWPPSFVKTDVIADDDKSYVFRKYVYKQGNGLSAANRRTAAMVKRYRADILTITDPYREAALYDLFPGLDVISTWTYTNPDPKMMLYVETLRAACKPTGQIPLQTITLLNYAGELAPTDEWTLMGPGRATVTTWIILSRAPKILGYYYSSVCDPVGVDTPRVPYSTSAAIKELSEKVFRPYGPMLTNLDVKPRRIAVLSSEAARVHGHSPQLRSGYNNEQIYPFYTVMAMAHLQADVIFDETVERYGLDAYDVLVLPKCDVLTETVYKRILQFRERGGIVIADQYLGPEIPAAIKFDFDFTYRKKVNANAIAKNGVYAEWTDHLQPGNARIETVQGVTALNDQHIMESYAQELKARLAGLVEPDVDCDSPAVLLNMLEKHGVKYLVVVNDRRTYDDRMGEYKAVLGKLEPQSATITLKRWEYPRLHPYDMLKRQPIKVEKVGAGYTFPVELSTLGGTIVALYPTNPGAVRVKAPKRLAAGLTYDITVDLLDEENNPLRGLQPIEVTVTDPDGKVNAYSDYYCAENGRLTVEFVPALNDTRGRWTASVLDLTAGLRSETTFKVVD
jgi:hypothetical protein